MVDSNTCSTTVLYLYYIVLVDSDMFMIPPHEFECKDPVGFAWWVVLHVAQLFGFDAHGNYDMKNIQVNF